jgi:hypothetical protein
VTFVLLIGCANIANLLLARAAAREKEMAVRTAMRASRSRLLAQLLVQSVTLSAFGGAFGVAGVLWAVAINRALPPNLLPVPEVHVDSAVLWFAAVLALGRALASLAYGVAVHDPATFALRGGCAHHGCTRGLRHPRTPRRTRGSHGRAEARVAGAAEMNCPSCGYSAADLPIPAFARETGCSR